MTESVDLAVIGAGPAGLAASTAAAKAGLEVVLLDDQSAVGGQIYRGIGRADAERERVLGADYVIGKHLADELASTSVRHLDGASVWQIDKELTLYYTRKSRGTELRAKHLIIATGAIERPMPFPGWTLPGVMTAGAGQTLLKSSGLVPSGPLVLAGSGPLLLLLAAQYLRAGVAIDALVETTPRANYHRALPHLPRALGNAGLLGKGVRLLQEIREHGLRHFKDARTLFARGDDEISEISFTSNGRNHTLPCKLLLVHQGVVPNVQITRALGLTHDWHERQRCWHPRLGTFGRTEIEGISVAGDGGGIGGAPVAVHQGRLSGLDAAHQLGAMKQHAFERACIPVQRSLSRVSRARPFVDALYAPADAFLNPSDDTIVCRCEEVTAGDVRGYVRMGCLGPNQTKAFGRPGMGPCQGRFCGLTVSEIIADMRDLETSDIGYYRIRFPVKPVTLGELAATASVEETAGS